MVGKVYIVSIFRYVSEYDLYEQSLERRHQETLQMLRKRRSRFSLIMRSHGNNFVYPGLTGGVGVVDRIQGGPGVIGDGENAIRVQPTSRSRTLHLLLCSR
jgi:hypothetical protein